MNANVTAEYLAERYVEEWRNNPSWKINSFRDRVLSDLGIKIGYYKAWLARGRAKFMIYGSASEQYARVWDYGKAVQKYSPGTVVNVVVDGLDRLEPPLFLRMYVCLSPLVRGFLKGCRPLIGVDGCLLKGSYPGQILVAVGKDGNNSIYPFAWATVEVENKETWCWFLECLKQSLDDLAMGGGFTYMSDRQKGLLEEFEEVWCPLLRRGFVMLANICPVLFVCSVYVLFVCSVCEVIMNAHFVIKADFEIAMESIRFLSEDAYEYLDNIPAQHWSRHAFSTNCKSNMLLNNMCETFNACIREAKDKPILTQMEWLRRYAMKRHNDKWEGVKKIQGKVMPYVTKLYERMERVVRHCIVQVSRDDTYEVNLNSDQVTVDLQNRTCTCYHWQLTGLPCVHGFSCILDKRSDPEEYVDHYYTRERYLEAYDLPVQPMPGPKHWEKIQLREPLPPPVRVMPGRPKSKKRKKEKGEGVADAAEGTSQKRQKRCQKCAQFGHYAKTCSNMPAEVKEPSSKPNSMGKPAVNTPWVVEQRRIKAARALNKTTPGASAGPNSIANKKFQQEEAKKKAATAAAKASSTAAAAAASQGAGAAASQGPKASSKTAAAKASQGASAPSQAAPSQRPNTRSRQSAGAEPYLCSQASTTTTTKNTTATRPSKKKN
ncbi:uncharacterized protein LOC110689025 [Chenopodium quinoa]|uniref:uncharacterized protein LOC110689025 n=1 Tax=Chenopodium quinoa TaxID=63459 RepID=UPI000B7941D1|nr:uncharacterized protein LOC110689025 [Chenopodium quinoa]